MVKYTSSLVVFALIVAPVLASSWDELDTRQISKQHVFGRELTETETIFGREADELFSRLAEDFAARELDVQDLSERSKIGRFFKKIWHGIKKVASVVIRREDLEDEILARDDEFDIRELDELFERYLEEIESRSPEFHLDARELDELDLDLIQRESEEGVYEREFDEELSGREFEFEEREIDQLD